jgi:mono/diheme cytochrome c family protein
MKTMAFALLFSGAISAGQVAPAISGKDLFNTHCAPCHGIDGKGNGPAAASFRKAPADLTALASRHGGKFPGAEVAKELSDVYDAPHGAKSMPVWGPVFNAISPKSDAVGTLRIANIVKYIETLQAK